MRLPFLFAISISLLASSAFAQNDVIKNFRSNSSTAVEFCQKLSLDELKSLEEYTSTYSLKQDMNHELIKASMRYGDKENERKHRAEGAQLVTEFNKVREDKRSKLASEGKKCQEEKANEVTSSFKKAISSLKKNTKLSGLLKNYTADVLTTLEVAITLENENSQSYTKRQAEANNALNRSWNLLQVEAM